MDRTNPFTPTFGRVPALLAGRQELVDRVLTGLGNGPGDPNWATLLVGARGSGKTALLTTLARAASERGWISADVTAAAGMLEDILQRAADSAGEFVNHPPSSRLTGLGAAGFSVSRQFTAPEQGNWRTRMNRLLEALSEHDIGLVLTVDELDAGIPELRQLLTTFQHFVREERKVALLMAGLPRQVSALLQDNQVSFYRRAFQHRLGPIKAHEAEEAIAGTVALSGRQIAEEALQAATAATGGFPFLIQLVGYHIWRQQPDALIITPAHARAGIEFARQDMEQMILSNTLRELSDQDSAFLRAMAEDAEISTLADVASRMGVTAKYAGVYRARLVAQGLISARGRGKLGFDLPMLRDHLLREDGIG
jgi:energy-coupling factor transporter ATP-binding protein EcfA2